MVAGKINIETSTPLMPGEVLRTHPKTQRFINHDKANQLLTREYPRPFVVPEKV